MSHFVFSNVVVFAFVIFSVSTDEESRVCTDTRCTCSRHKGNITAVCRMSHLENISQSFITPLDVNVLDLSNNEIRVVKQNTFENFSGLLNLEMSQNLLEELLPNGFAGLKKLLNLSLTYNNIQVIYKDAFSGLYSLQKLNLTGNKLQTWNARDSSMHLKSLMIIDVQGNMGWRPEEKYLLELPRLKEIRNVSWAAECMDCWLIRNASENDIKKFNNSYFEFQTTPFTCYKKHYKNISDYLRLLARNHFLVRKCRSLFQCIERKEVYVTWSFPCWPTNQRVLSMQLVFGIIGGCLNMVVLFNILLTKVLRKNVSMVLVSNLALGDTLICMYSAIMAAIIVSNEYEDLYNHSDSISDIQCPRVGSLWVLGQCTTSITSVALTIERYLCIVFSMKPDIRMTPRLASLAIAFNWVIAVSMMSIAHYLDIYPKNFLCIPVTYDTLRLPRETRYTIAMGSAGITLYLVTIPLYVHIYRVVKQSSQQMGVQRESTLAKRIAVLVGTNLVFFFMPIILLAAWNLLVTSGHNLSIFSRRAIDEWIPLYCLSINSCLNPLVHAFRNDKFKNALKRNLPSRCKRNHITPAVPVVPLAGIRNASIAKPAVKTASSRGVSKISNVTPSVQAALPGGISG
ncbi:uncharacterized protein LOC144653830 [Oculina patagonica]